MKTIWRVVRRTLAVLLALVPVAYVAEYCLEWTNRPVIRFPQASASERGITVLYCRESTLSEIRFAKRWGNVRERVIHKGIIDFQQKEQ